MSLHARRSCSNSSAQAGARSSATTRAGANARIAAGADAGTARSRSNSCDSCCACVRRSPSATAQALDRDAARREIAPGLHLVEAVVADEPLPDTFCGAFDRRDALDPSRAAVLRHRDHRPGRRHRHARLHDRRGRLARRRAAHPPADDDARCGGGGDARCVPRHGSHRTRCSSATTASATTRRCWPRAIAWRGVRIRSPGWRTSTCCIPRAGAGAACTRTAAGDDRTAGAAHRARGRPARFAGAGGVAVLPARRQRAHAAARARAQPPGRGEPVAFVAAGEWGWTFGRWADWDRCTSDRRRRPDDIGELRTGIAFSSKMLPILPVTSVVHRPVSPSGDHRRHGLCKENGDAPSILDCRSGCRSNRGHDACGSYGGLRRHCRRHHPESWPADPRRSARSTPGFDAVRGHAVPGRAAQRGQRTGRMPTPGRRPRHARDRGRRWCWKRTTTTTMTRTPATSSRRASGSAASTCTSAAGRWLRSPAAPAYVERDVTDYTALLRRSASGSCRAGSFGDPAVRQRCVRARDSAHPRLSGHR